MKNGKEISDPDCVMCKRNFASNSGLDKHINANHESMKYPLLDETFCQQGRIGESLKDAQLGVECGNKSSTPNDLNNHIQKVHKESSDDDESYVNSKEVFKKQTQTTETDEEWGEVDC